jgi:hypothetical protein
MLSIRNLPNIDPILFRDFQESENPKTSSKEDSDTESIPEEKNLYCATCNWKITKEDQKTSMRGKTEHTFFNPQGNVFHIGCFKEAPGCMAVGLPSYEFSWFSGYAWQIICCSSCQEHLGWIFLQGLESHFFGLILVRLKQD